MSATDPSSLTACLAMMDSHQLHRLLARNPKTSPVWMRALANEGLPYAQLSLGRMLLEGSGMAMDRPAALAWFHRAAAGADPATRLDAINMVGRCHDNGWGTHEDATAAARAYHHAAESGHAWARYNLGHLYLEGRGVVRDLPIAYGWYRRAADQGHARAMNLVGRCLEQGWGVPQDDAQAASWYRRSAEGGYFRGQYNWASMLLRDGREDEAAAWFERAALGGTDGVRRAVLDVVSTDAHPALRQLTERLRVDALAKAA